VEESGYRSLWVNHPPGEDGNRLPGRDGLRHRPDHARDRRRAVSAVPPDAILRRIDETGLPAERLRSASAAGRGSGRWSG
jgi:hypothetical protein